MILMNLKITVKYFSHFGLFIQITLTPSFKKETIKGYELVLDQSGIVCNSVQHE